MDAQIKKNTANTSGNPSNSQDSLKNSTEMLAQEISLQLLNQISLPGGEIEIKNICYSFFFRNDKHFECIWQNGYGKEKFNYSFLRENPEILKPVLSSGFAILPVSEQGFSSSSSICAVVESANRPKYLLLVEFSSSLDRETFRDSGNDDEERDGKASSWRPLANSLRLFLAFLLQQFWMEQRAGAIFLPVWLEEILMDRKIYEKETMLIVAETGSVQDEFIAKLLHRHGKIDMRRVRYFYPSRLSPEVQNREIFGAPAGARLGHDAGAIGLVHEEFMQAIVIYEVSDLDLAVQQRLFDYFSAGVGRQLWIFETSRDLVKMVEFGKFSAQLHRFLQTTTILLPPLRVKKNRLLAECNRFLRHLSQKYTRKATFTSEAEENLVQYDWPGNWHELKSTLESAFHLSKDKVIDIDDLRFIRDGANLHVGSLDLRRSLKQLEKKIILQAYSLHAGNQVQMARALGISRGSLQYKLQRYHLESENK